MAKNFLTIFAKCSILDVWHGFEYASEVAMNCGTMQENKSYMQ